MSFRNKIQLGLLSGFVFLWGLPINVAAQVAVPDDDYDVVVDTVEVDSVEADMDYDVTSVDTTIVVRTIADAFCVVPDSLMPYLSRNNCLDFIDYMKSDMKAEVTNLLDGISEMTALTDDSLSIHMNDLLRVDMMLLSLDEPLDTIHKVIVFAETFFVDSIYGETSIRCYTVDWQPVTRDIPWNDVQKKRIEALSLQNILKWNDRVLNNS